MIHLDGADERLSPSSNYSNPFSVLLLRISLV